MSKPGLPDDVKVQKLEHFKDKVEEASPPKPPPMPPDSEEKKEIVNERPRNKKACVEELRQRPEVEQAFREVEQKVSEGFGEEVATKLLESSLGKVCVPANLTCPHK